MSTPIGRAWDDPGSWPAAPLPVAPPSVVPSARSVGGFDGADGYSGIPQKGTVLSEYTGRGLGGEEAPPERLE